MNARGNSGDGATLDCSAISQLLVFYACDEVSDAERAAIDAHLGACSECARQLAQERKLLDTLAARVPPADVLDSAGVLLAQCRSQLAEKIDDLATPLRKERWRPFGWVRRAMALRPVWSGAALVIFGVALGTQLLPWLQTANDVAGPAVNVLAAPRLTDEQLSKMAVAGVRVSPAENEAGENIQLRLSAEQPMVLSGNINDGDVRRVLTYVVANGGRFDTGVRLDCLDALKSRTDDEQVRQALLSAARTDQSAAMRMKALESLRDAADEDDVREAMLGILAHDASPGVRVEAVNLLVRSLQQEQRDALDAGDQADAIAKHETSGPADAGDHASLREDGSANAAMETAIRALTELQQRDPNRDVRLRSAAALRQIAARPQP